MKHHLLNSFKYPKNQEKIFKIKLKKLFILNLQKMRNLLKPIFTLLSIGVFFNSCKKNADIDPAISVNSFAKIAVNRWTSQYAESGTSTSFQKISTLVNLIDYSEIKEIKRVNRSPLVLIHIKQNDKSGRKQYLAFSTNNKEDNKTQFEGIYFGKDIEMIKKAIQTNRLPSGQIITVSNINGNPISEWEAYADGKMTFKIAKSKNNHKEIKRGNKIISQQSVKNGESIFLLPIEDPETVCIDWYWVSWDMDSGEVLSEDYLRTECYTRSNDGASEGSPTSIQCEDPMANARSDNEFLGAIDEEDGSGNSSIVRNRKFLWRAVKGSTWNINSLEKSSQSFSTQNGGEWYFINLWHVSLSTVGFIAGGTVTTTLLDATPSVGTTIAGMSLVIHVDARTECNGVPVLRAFDFQSNIVLRPNQMN